MNAHPDCFDLLPLDAKWQLLSMLQDVRIARTAELLAMRSRAAEDVINMAAAMGGVFNIDHALTLLSDAVAAAQNTIEGV